ncbi:MAG: large subunit ribosomal protein L4 [Parcubacteria group bacterium Gr01-1014_46]|nr:MAG: large subunit ribosomal protein L4 [Parcubacteria group bacterium Gr01-1014_46]
MEDTKTKKVVKKAKTEKTVTPLSLETVVYNQKGKEVGKVKLPENVFGVKWNADLVHQVVTSMESSARVNVAHTKTRGEVRGGGKKPWQQKGTGRARHGSTRSPIWRHGGVTHGPRNDKNYDKKVNKKMKAKALYTILSAKYKKGQIFFVDDLALRVSKTKEAVGVLQFFSKVDGFKDILSKKKNSAYIALPSKDVSTEKSFANLNNLLVDEIRNMSPLDLMKYKYVVISNPDVGLPQISSKLENKEKRILNKE